MGLPRPGTIDLWSWDLDVTVDRLAALEATLNADERRRRDRFYFSRDAARFVAARGQLRTILAKYLHLGADAVRFDYNEYGKPCLRRSGTIPPVFFNLTHSDGLAALAVASDRAVGVDIERMRTVAEDVTNWIMTDEEKRCFRSLSPELRRDAFFQCWTRKEAVLKAIGHGFSLSPRCLEVSFGVNDHSRLLRIGGDRLSTQV
jgi:4'-phosphopantetheinyl transferase